MIYLVLEIWTALWITFIVGGILGYTIGKYFARCNNNASQTSSPTKEQSFLDNILATNVNLDSDDYAVETLEGIGKYTGQRFREEGGIATVADVLRNLKTQDQRVEFSEKMGMKIQPIHEWASMADLLRIEGMDHQFAELTQACGVHTIAQLAVQKPKKFTQLMAKTNTSRRQLIAPIAPEEHDVFEWIEQAKAMPAVVEM